MYTPVNGTYESDLMVSKLSFIIIIIFILLIVISHFQLSLHLYLLRWSDATHHLSTLCYIQSAILSALVNPVLQFTEALDDACLSETRGDYHRAAGVIARHQSSPTATAITATAVTGVDTASWRLRLYTSSLRYHQQQRQRAYIYLYIHSHRPCDVANAKPSGKPRESRVYCTGASSHCFQPIVIRSWVSPSLWR